MILTFGLCWMIVYIDSWHHPSVTDSLSLEWGPTMCGYFNKLPCVIVMGQFGDHTDRLCAVSPRELWKGSEQESGTSGSVIC